MAAIIQPNRCNCRNCRYVEKQRSNILRAVRPAGKGISDDMVAIWNDALANYPCEFNQPPAPLRVASIKFELDEEKSNVDTLYIDVTVMFVDPDPKIKLEIII